MNRPPAFQFYVKDWLTSRKIAVMDLAQVGAYSFLLAACWDSDDCSLPDDAKTLAALSRMGEQWFTDASVLVRACFIPHPKHPGHLTNERLLKEFHSLLKFRRNKQRAGHIGGVKSGLSRRQIRVKHIEADLEHTFDSASSTTEAKRTSSSSSSSSISERKEKRAGSDAPSPANHTVKERRIRVPDETFIAELKTNPAYVEIDIDREIGKIQAWLLTPKGCGKTLTRQRLVNWLNGVDVPMNGHRASRTCTKQVQGDRFLEPCGQPASAESRATEPRCAEHLSTATHMKELSHAAH
jgi:uncharacterized protein YdaU (DUF1376 family)